MSDPIYTPYTQPQQPSVLDDMTEIDVEATQTYDMSTAVPTEHRHELIVGNELRCTLHDGSCPVIRIKPTEVLERNDAGELVLIDKMP